MTYPTLFFSSKNRHCLLKRDGVCNPVTHVLKALETVKRFSRGCKPRPAPFYKPNCSRLSGKNEGRQNRHYLPLGCAIILACLTGCGTDDFADLKQYISTVKAVPKGRIPPLPEIKAVETFVFNPTGLRDPFKPLAQPEQPDATPVLTTGSGIKPDFTRRKEELELLPLEDLKMVGTIKMKSILWGLVKAGDGSIHRVQTGNYMGKNYGKIIRISVDKIELMEIVTEKPGVWHEQQTALALTE